LDLAETAANDTTGIGQIVVDDDAVRGIAEDAHDQIAVAVKIDLLGTRTQVDVSGWFSGSGNQLQEITAGGLKIDSQISQLVQAMATYSANNPGFDPTAPAISSLPNDANLQTALATAWHA